MKEKNKIGVERKKFDSYGKTKHQDVGETWQKGKHHMVKERKAC